MLSSGSPIATELSCDDRDYANFAEGLGMVDKLAWTTIIRLGNRLVHDYPLQPEAQLELLSQACMRRCRS
ncbi:hypothetical protein AB5I41_16365 [Sphingomonas sp. MMS24-JH45]